MDIWYESLLGGHPPKQSRLDGLSEFGRHRVHQGVSLPGLLQAYRIGSRVIWEELLAAVSDDPDLQRELLLKVSPYILLHFDLLGQTIGQAYSQEEQNLARWRDRLSHDLCSVIFSTAPDPGAFRELALALGLDDSAPHVAVAVEVPVDERGSGHLHADYDTALEALCDAVDSHRDDFLHFHRHDHLLAWLPLATGEAAIMGERRIAGAASAVADCIGQRSAGTGLPDSGPAGWRRSVDQAVRAIDLGRRLSPSRRVFRYIDVSLDDAILGDEATARFVQGLLERLAVETQLLETLETYFERRGYRKLIAGDLGIHPNTLTYRLDRIQSILGIELDDPNWQATLHTALRLRQMSASTRS